MSLPLVFERAAAGWALVVVREVGWYAELLHVTALVFQSRVTGRAKKHARGAWHELFERRRDRMVSSLEGLHRRLLLDLLFCRADRPALQSAEVIGALDDVAVRHPAVNAAA